jgi:hypothetical protein
MYTKEESKALREEFWELEYIRENGKSVSRIYLQKEGIDIYNKDT